MALAPGIYDVRYRQGGVVRGTGSLALETTAIDDAVSGAFNVAKGAAAQLVEDNPNALVALLLRAQEVDDTLDNYDSVSAMLAASGNTEADFTNYARKTGITGTVTVDDSGDVVTVDIPDQTWTSAGGATDNVLVKLVVAVQTGGDDTTLIPLTHHNFQVFGGLNHFTRHFITTNDQCLGVFDGFD